MQFTPLAVTALIGFLMIWFAVEFVMAFGG